MERDKRGHVTLARALTNTWTWWVLYSTHLVIHMGAGSAGLLLTVYAAEDPTLKPQQLNVNYPLILFTRGNSTWRRALIC